jgi:NNP family nitrate/nitrite transporter-like MFS transporter
MQNSAKAPRIVLCDFTTPPMRAFHMAWGAFFVSFFGWFGIAPLMAIVRDDLQLTQAQIGTTIVASVAIPVLVRLLIGPLCERYGARLTYTWLLLLGAIPVLGIGLATSYETFLLFRLAIGILGASFVITQYHTSVMFAPNCVGTANATAAGWGNLGGGVTQIVMPLSLVALVSLGVDRFLGWRLAMVLPGVGLLGVALAYYRLTQDAPAGNYRQLRATGTLPPLTGKAHGTLLLAAKDMRVWALCGMYAACFGIEITMHNIAALYYHDRFGLDVTTAGLIAGLFGLMNLFARALGGILSDRIAVRAGLKGRARLLGSMLLLEGIALMVFTRLTSLGPAIVAMLIFALFVKMASGATYGLVPFMHKKAMGSVTGIVGAGGNAGAMAAGCLFRLEALALHDALLILGILVTLAAGLAFLVRFSPQAEAEERQALREALAARRVLAGATS